MLNKERKVFQVSGSGLTVGYKMLDKLFEKFQEGYRPPNDKEQQIPNRPEITPRKARFVLFKDDVGSEELVAEEDVEDVGVSMDNTKKEILAYAESKGIEVSPVDNKESLLKAINGA